MICRTEVVIYCRFTMKNSDIIEHMKVEKICHCFYQNDCHDVRLNYEEKYINC